jgi:hypothetical protein
VSSHHLIVCYALILATGCDDSAGGVADPVVDAQLDVVVTDQSLLDAGQDVAPMDGSTPMVDSGSSDFADGSPPMPDATPSRPPRTRATCFDGMPTETDLEPAPTTCRQLFNERPDLESGCYLLNDGMEGVEPSFCWHRRALIFLANNEIETAAHPDDTDGDGVIDRGESSGQNFPADPFGGDVSSTKARLQTEIEEWFGEVSYDALYLEVTDIITPIPDADQPDRWFRLQQLRPGFAHIDFFGEYCRRRGGMTIDDWLEFDYFVTIISHGTEVSGSQWRAEELPVGQDCQDRFPIPHNYAVVKNFRSWNRLGTLFHEIAHGFNRDPSAEPSVGHSESVHATSGEATEYGDRSDVMGHSTNRGHFSLPQKLFTRLLPLTSVEDIPSEEGVYSAEIHPLESHERNLKGLRITVNEGLSYYVEMRANLGNDTRIPAILKAGALIKRANPVRRANKSWIMDPTPETPTTRSGDSVLLAHRTYSDPLNGLFISVVEHSEEMTSLIVRRGDASVAPPVITGVMNDSDGLRLMLTADARPGDDTIPPEDLLYYWRIGPRDTLVTPGNYAGGPVVDVELEERDTPVWLLVSDQRGGETWAQVWPSDAGSE